MIARVMVGESSGSMAGPVRVQSDTTVRLQLKALGHVPAIAVLEKDDHVINLAGHFFVRVEGSACGPRTRSTPR